jgi:hypothetical protein
MNPTLHQFIVDYGLWAVLAGTFLEGESVVVLAVIVPWTNAL